MTSKQLKDVLIRTAIVGILLAEGLYIIGVNQNKNGNTNRTYYHRDLEGINNGTEGEI